jgi:hypothetical protein
MARGALTKAREIVNMTFFKRGKQNARCRRPPVAEPLSDSGRAVGEIQAFCWRSLISDRAMMALGGVANRAFLNISAQPPWQLPRTPSMKGDA